MENIRLIDIENVYRADLETSKLHALENSYDSFEAQLNSRNNPIALDRSSRPYKIINGRHRIFLARQKGYSSVHAVFV
jgi:hypothetical protein